MEGSMRILRKLFPAARSKSSLTSEEKAELEARVGTMEHDFQRLSHDVTMVLLPETRPLARRYPT
jgi:hypothetical protein